MPPRASFPCKPALLSSEPASCSTRTLTAVSAYRQVFGRDPSLPLEQPVRANDAGYSGRTRCWSPVCEFDQLQYRLQLSWSVLEAGSHGFATACRGSPAEPRSWSTRLLKPAWKAVPARQLLQSTLPFGACCEDWGRLCCLGYYCHRRLRCFRGCSQFGKAGCLADRLIGLLFKGAKAELA